MSKALAFAATVLMGATWSAHSAIFDQITVHRINVIEPDGTLRMVISDAAEAPGSPYHGRMYFRSDREDAGLIFVNNEGTEEGGLIYSGRKGKNGKVSSSGHLSFDSYDQDQTLVLQVEQSDTIRKATYLQINDEPSWDVEEVLELIQADAKMPKPERQAAVNRFLASHPRPRRRIYLGTEADHSANLVLRDADGRKRIVMKVAPDGTPVLQFLDASGKLVEQLPRATKR